MEFPASHHSWLTLILNNRRTHLGFDDHILSFHYLIMNIHFPLVLIRKIFLIIKPSLAPLLPGTGEAVYDIMTV